MICFINGELHLVTDTFSNVESSIPKLENDMKLAVDKHNLEGQIVDKRPVDSKKPPQMLLKD